MKKRNKDADVSGPIGYGRLVFEALPEIFSFQLFSGLLLAVLSGGLNRLISLVAESGGAALTTANLGDLLFSWRGPVILLLGTLMMAVFAVLEIFAGISLYDDILSGRCVRISREIRNGFLSLRRFLCPSGVLVLLYIFLAVPLGGIGFSISLTRRFYIPHFIMEVIRSTPLYHVAYCVLMAALMAVGIAGIFTLHGVILDHMQPAAAFKASWRLMKKNWKRFLPSMVIAILVILLVIILFAILVELPAMKLEAEAARFPQDYQVDPKAVLGDSFTELDISILLYRFCCAFLVLGGGFLIYQLVMISGSYLMLRFTRCYLEYTREIEVKWPPRPKRRRYTRYVLSLIFTILLLLALSVGIALTFDVIFHREEPVHIVAHRTGGVMAAENSLEGLELAIAHGCYAGETDTQRTKDGFYIINHDDDFKRLTGVAKKPGDLTREEILTLTITDPATGTEAKVPTLEEMLDVTKGRIRLFLELKGVSADRQMVDDVVKIIREKDCVADVTLISLKYDVIDYAETQYPEFETGVLMFGGFGDVSRVNADLLILEEEMATENRIASIHEQGKEVYVWTINTEDGLYKFLDSQCDGIITDQVELAQSVQKKLDDRSDLQLLKDALSDVWN